MKHRILIIIALLGIMQTHAQHTPDSCIITSLPYVQDFEDCPTGMQGVDSVFVPCWHRLSNDPIGVSNIIYITTYGAIHHTSHSNRASNRIHIYKRITDTYACFVLPEIDSTLCADIPMQMRISYGTAGQYGTQNFSIGVMTDPTDITTFTSLHHYTLNQRLYYWREFDWVVSLAGDSLVGKHLAVKYDFTSRDISDNIEKITIEEISDCATITNLRCSNNAATGMRVDWDVLRVTMTDSISYRVKLFPVFSGSNLPPDSAAITSFVTTRQYAVFRGLTPNTEYSAVVSAECSGDTGALQWDCISFRTLNTTDTCPYPYTFVTENDTTSITLEWISDVDSLGWDIDYCTHNTSSSYGPMMTGTRNWLDNSYTLHGLQPGTRYEVWIRPVCQERWTTLDATTLCAIQQLPWFEDFEDVENFNPTCWYNSVSPILDGTTRCFYINSPDYCALPQMDGVISNLHFSGMIKDGVLVAGVMPYDSVYTFIPVDTVYAPANGSWSHFDVFYDNYTGPDGRIALWTTSDMHTTYLDNLTVDTIASCSEPYDVEVSGISFSSATVSWSDHNNAMSYELEYGPHGFAHGDGTVVGVFNDSITLMGLRHSTRYDAYVRSHCWGDTSVWSYPVSFRTLCGDIDYLPYVEDFESYNHGTRPTCWTIPTYYGPGVYALTPENNVLRNTIRSLTMNILPRIDHNRIPLQGTRLTLNAWNGVVDGLSTIVVGVVSDLANADSTFVPVDTLRVTNYTPVRYEVLFNTYGDTGEYIALQQEVSNVLYLDDVMVDYIPDCRHPGDFSATHVDSTRAQFTWIPPGNSTQWEIAYGTRGFDPDIAGATVVPTTTFPEWVGSLQPGSDYDFYMRSICPLPRESYDTSEWTVSPLTITTMQRAASVPYQCNFEDTAEARCWQTRSSSLTNWIYDTMPGDTTQHGYRIEVTRNPETVVSENVNMVLYRDIDFGTVPAGNPSFNNNLSLSFRTMIGSEDPSNTMGIYVFFVSPTEVPYVNSYRSMTPWGDVDSLDILMYTNHYPDWRTDTVELDTMQGVHRLVFYVRRYVDNQSTVPSSTPAYIDDVQIFHSPCPRPFNMVADSLGTNSARLSWYGDPTARYLVSYRPAGDPDSHSITDTAYTNHILLSGLEIASQYEATVWLFCNDSLLSDSCPTLVFSTLLCEGLRSDTVEHCTQAVQSSLVPVSYNDICSYSQQIYPNTAFSGQGTLQAVNLNFGPFSAYANFNESRIYLGHTSRSQFNGTEDFIDPASLQMVYFGPMPTQQGWNKIVFQTPFEYDGESNLVLAIVNNSNRNKPTYYYACPQTENTGIVFHGRNAVDLTSIETLSQYNGEVSLTAVRSQAVFDFCPPGSCPYVRLKRPNLRYSRVSLRWHGDTSSLYEVNYRLITGNRWETVFTTDTVLLVENVYPNYEYVYRVRKVCDDSSIVWQYGTFRTSPDDCAFPENLRLTELSHSQASFTWTPDENNTQFRLHIFNSAFDTIITSYLARKTVTGLTPGLRLFASVQAQCSPDNRSGEWSDTLQFTTPVCPTSYDLTYSDLQGNSVVLDWQSDPQVSQWEIQYGPIGFTQDNGNSVIADHHPYTLSGLIGETSYDAYVRSVCDNNWYSESWSNKTTFTTLYSDIDSQLSTHNFQLTPNPARNSVTVTLNSQISNLNSRLILRDATGRELYSTNISNLNFQISILNYPAGIYFVTLVTPQSTTTLKLIIEN